MESSGAHALAAESLSDARRALERLAPAVILMGLEGQDGVDLLRSLQQREPAPELIVHTESTSSLTAVWAAEQQVQEVFEKPVAPSVLLDWTQRLLRRRRGEPESVTLQRCHVGLGRLLGGSNKIQTLREQVLRVAEFPLMSVLVCGETGTGKELVARAIHELTCPEAPFVSLNCAAIPENLFESEFFGHCAGAFTGAKTRRTGLLEEAASGTFFLDEVGELPTLMQPKLLRVLETRAFRPVGGNRELPLEARIIAATNRTLTQARETFRPDLYYRLAGFALDTPALRERREDVLLLANAFLREFCRFHGRPTMKISPEASALLKEYGWPGNVRELRGVIENAAVSAYQGVIRRVDIKLALGSRGASLSSPSPENEASRDVVPAPASIELPQAGDSSSLPQSREGRAVEPSEPLSSEREGVVSGAAALTQGVPSTDEYSATAPSVLGSPSSGLALVGKGAAFASLPELEQYVITEVYEQSRGNLSRAARTLGIPRSTLRDRLKKFGIAPLSSQKRESGS